MSASCSYASSLMSSRAALRGTTPLSARRSAAGARGTRSSKGRAAMLRTVAHSVFEYTQVEVDTIKGIALFDITPQINDAIAKAGVKNGFVNVISRHTTTAITINEYEDRLVDDVRQYLLKLAPPDYPYLHNDIHVRSGPPDWPGGDEAWRAQEPENCHSHLLSMLLGNSETIPVSDGELVLGTWQSCMLVELDGPRKRTVGIQVVGETKKTAAPGPPAEKAAEKKAPPDVAAPEKKAAAAPPPPPKAAAAGNKSSEVDQGEVDRRVKLAEEAAAKRKSGAAVEAVDPSDPGIASEELMDGGLDKFCDEEPDSDECKIYSF